MSRRLVLPLALFLAFFLAVPALIASWYYSDELNRGAFRVEDGEPGPNVTIISADEGVVVLSPLTDVEHGDWRKDGVFGLEWDGGYAQLGAIRDLHDSEVRREITVLTGSLPVGGSARIDSFAYEGTPTVHGLAFEEVHVETPLGVAPAWLVPRSSDTWCIVVHGKGASREESLRILPSLRSAGLTTLVITYRNDPEASQARDTGYTYGRDEWEDLAAAMDYATAAGARRFVLVGFSMGGAIVLSLMEQPSYAEQVSALILDAPLIDLKETVEFRAGKRGLPSPFTSFALTFSRLRFGFDWADFDHTDVIENLKVPVLLFHGDDDPTVPVATSDAVAAGRTDIVEYHRAPGAGHVRSWNADPEAYDETVRAFIGRVLR